MTLIMVIHPRLKNSPFEALIVSHSTYQWRKMALVLNKLDNLLLKKLPILHFGLVSKGKEASPFAKARE